MNKLTHHIREDLKGDVTRAHAVALRKLPLAQTDELIVSMVGVRAVDADGVAMLMRLAAFMRRHGKRLMIQDVSARVHRVLSHFAPIARVLAPPAPRRSRAAA